MKKGRYFRNWRFRMNGNWNSKTIQFLVSNIYCIEYFNSKGGWKRGYVGARGAGEKIGWCAGHSNCRSLRAGGSSNSRFFSRGGVSEWANEGVGEGAHACSRTRAALLPTTWAARQSTQVQVQVHAAHGTHGTHDTHDTHSLLRCFLPSFLLFFPCTSQPSTQHNTLTFLLSSSSGLTVTVVVVVVDVELMRKPLPPTTPHPPVKWQFVFLFFVYFFFLFFVVVVNIIFWLCRRIGWKKIVSFRPV